MNSAAPFSANAPANAIEAEPRVIVDAQIHLWLESRPYRPWVPGRNAQLPEPFTYERYLAMREGSGVDRAIIVPPSIEGIRTDYAQEAVNKHPDVFRIMALIDPTRPDLAAAFPRWREQTGVLGIRMACPVEHPEWLLNGTTDWIWPAAEKAGLPIMFLTTGQLHLFDTIAERHPNLPLIIDHLGVSYAALQQGLFDQTIDAAVALAKYPNVSIKLSSLGLFSREVWPWRDLDDTIKRLFDVYGPERCYWGTDVTASIARSEATYRQRVTHFTEELGFFSESDLDWIMGRAILKRLDWQ
ncbi:amidohydrolase family protein [Novosphingobium flavum]|uniref:Amidohydrolase family protein n=2 Tax=Novosphingobium flavum TaxID=1778672 RepID=A0A7X1KMV8_9SPHN|nr:amidohydrolase family protein [Novosphingobium flavum]